MKEWRVRRMMAVVGVEWRSGWSKSEVLQIREVAFGDKTGLWRGPRCGS